MTSPDDNLVGLLQSRAAEQGSRAAYTFLEDGRTETGTLTYAELDRAARRIGAALRSSLRRGDRALLVMPSGLEFLQAFFGCLYAGAVPVPLYPPRRNRIDQRIRAVAADAEAAVALTTTTILDDLQQRLENAAELDRLRWLATDGDLAGDESAALEPTANPESLAFLQYTSGSMAAPKGVMITHAHLIAT